jgi:hypothetical protein
MSEPKDKIEQTLEVLLYAPIGVGLYLRDMAPTFIARGRAEVDRRQSQVQQRTTSAKSIGQVAVGFGIPMARQRVERELGSARERAQSFLGVIGSATATANGTAAPARPVAVPDPPAPKPAPAAAPTAVADPTAPPVVSNETLPIPGYDALSASQVVERLAGLSTDELDAVRGYESAHRNRRTILGKIDQISA